MIANARLLGGGPEPFSEKKIAQLAQPKVSADLIAAKRPVSSLAGGTASSSNRIVSLLKETFPALPGIHHIFIYLLLFFHLYKHSYLLLYFSNRARRGSAGVHDET